MTTLVAAVFVASVLGSLHCAGMCGGVLLLCFGAAPEPGAPRPWRLHAAYHLGRGATYAALGFLAGAVGGALDLGGAAVGLPRAAAVAAGAVMIGYGAVTLLGRGVRRRGCGGGGAFAGIFRRGLVAVIDRPPLERALAIGLLTGLLPCGWLWAFLATAAGTGGAAAGALTMTVFWAGTLPVMVTLGIGVQRASGPLERHLPWVSAVLVMAVGCLTVLARLEAPEAAASIAAAPASLAEAAAQAATLGNQELPCCHAGP